MPEQNKQIISQVKKLPAGSSFGAFALVTNITEKISKSGKPFWDLSLSDKSDTITSRVWSSVTLRHCSADKHLEKELTPEETLNSVRELKGRVIWTIGKIDEYNGAPQYILNSVFVIAPDTPGCQPENFVQTADTPLEKLEKDFRAIIDNSTDGEIQKFLRFVFDPQKPLWTSFKTLPGAVKNHHAYASGLLEHSLGTAKSAVAIANSYKGSAYEPDVGVVAAGALLHDLGKIDCYTLTPAPDSTLECTIFDHIATGYATFMKLADEFKLSPLLRAHLGHIILSHHGEREYGSPVVPATPEAMIVSQADMLDFSLNVWTQEVKTLDGGMSPVQGVSQKNFTLGRRLWKWKESTSLPPGESES